MPDNVKNHNLYLHKQHLQVKAKEYGFFNVGITSANHKSYLYPGLQEYLANNYHGDMIWLGNDPERRSDPELLLNGVKSIIMLASSYTPTRDPLSKIDFKGRGNIASYACRRDYHTILKKKLKSLALWHRQQTGADFKLAVDTSPLMEKPLAELAGIGWQGKHSNLVARDGGSWFFIAAILTTATMPYDRAATNNCGTCRACLDICPTNAFPQPYVLDARKCIAYLTIEHKGVIPHHLRPHIGNRIFGCDDCLAICPWNKFAVRVDNTELNERAEIDLIALGNLVTLDDKSFRQMFAGTALKRTGRDRFIRNVLIAIANYQNPDLLPSVLPLVDDPEPLVRGAAVWAMANISTEEIFLRQFNKNYSLEKDERVIAEWLVGHELCRKQSHNRHV